MATMNTPSATIDSSVMDDNKTIDTSVDTSSKSTIDGWLSDISHNSSDIKTKEEFMSALAGLDVSVVKGLDCQTIETSTQFMRVYRFGENYTITNDDIQEKYSTLKEIVHDNTYNPANAVPADSVPTDAVPPRKRPPIIGTHSKQDERKNERAVETVLLGLEDDCRQFILDASITNNDTKVITTMTFNTICSTIEFGIFDKEKYTLYFFLRWGKIDDKLTDMLVPRQYYVPSFLVLNQQSGQEKNVSILKRYKEISQQWTQPKKHYLFYYTSSGGASPNKPYKIPKRESKIIQSLKMEPFIICQSGQVSSNLKIVAEQVWAEDSMCMIL